MMSPIQHASRAGVILGVYFALKYVFLMYALLYPMLMLVFTLVTLGVPFIAYRLTRAYRQQVAPQGAFRLSTAWAHGLFLYMFASIIVLPLHYYFYVHMLPEQLPHFARMLEELYSSMPNSQASLQSLYGSDPIQLLEQASSLPVGERLLSDFSSNVFWGGVFSLINALLLRRRDQASVI